MKAEQRHGSTGSGSLGSRRPDPHALYWRARGSSKASGGKGQIEPIGRTQMDVRSTSTPAVSFAQIPLKKPSSIASDGEDRSATGKFERVL